MAEVPLALTPYATISMPMKAKGDFQPAFLGIFNKPCCDKKVDREARGGDIGKEIR